MQNRPQKISSLIIFLLLTAFLAQTCAPKSNILGNWNSGEPSNMQFNFRSDGSVWLISQNASRQIWRYELIGNNTLRLYDGQGRIEEYGYTVLDDTLTFYNLQTGQVVEKYTRMKS
jgi:hypothetical protein